MKLAWNYNEQNSYIWPDIRLSDIRYPEILLAGYPVKPYKIYIIQGEQLNIAMYTYVYTGQVTL